jgi:hypothetical protein
MLFASARIQEAPTNIGCGQEPLAGALATVFPAAIERLPSSNLRQTSSLYLRIPLETLSEPGRNQRGTPLARDADPRASCGRLPSGEPLLEIVVDALRDYSVF